VAVLDALIRDVRVVRPDAGAVEAADVGITGGAIARVAPGIDSSEAHEIVEGGGKVAFPSAVDAHKHWGIYNPLDVDTRTESRAAAHDGVAVGLGQYYLNRSGPYVAFLPQVSELADGNAHVDYAFHLAAIVNQHIEELECRVVDHGVAHLEFVTRGIQRLREARPDLADRISLSMHFETAEIVTAYMKLVGRDLSLSGLEAYHRSRPPHSEGLAIAFASYLAHETGVANINLLHLSSATALGPAQRMRSALPHVDSRREVTIGHLLAGIKTAGIEAKVNPPIRPREDVKHSGNMCSAAMLTGSSRIKPAVARSSSFARTAKKCWSRKRNSVGLIICCQVWSPRVENVGYRTLTSPVSPAEIRRHGTAWTIRGLSLPATTATSPWSMRTAAGSSPRVAPSPPRSAASSTALSSAPRW